MLTAEKAIIGCALLDKATISIILARLTDDDFEDESARAAFAAIRTNKTSDPVILEAAMTSCGLSFAKEFIADCVTNTPTTTNCAEYCQIVRDDANRRRLTTIADSITVGNYEQRPASDIMCEAMNALGDIRTAAQSRLKQPNELIIAWADAYETKKKNPSAGWCRSGYDELDEKLGGGFINSGLYIIGARPGMGKTTFALNIADRIAAHRNPILFCTLEMSAEQITAKRIAIAGELPYKSIMKASLTDAEENFASLATERLGKVPFYLLDDAAAGVADIEAAARQIDGLRCIMVDYLGLIRSKSQVKKLYEQVTEISRDLKGMAMRLGLPVIALCQLNRNSPNAKDKKPSLADLRDSGAIEQDADGVLLLYRDSYFSKDKTAAESPSEELEVIIAKNRHGDSNRTVQLTWFKATGVVNEYECGGLPFEQVQI